MKNQVKLFMKTYIKIFTIMCVLALAVAARAQTVIGSWLTAPIPPTPANDEGWQRGQGGFGPDGSIFASSNSPAFFELKSGVAAGYAQSLDVHLSLIHISEPTRQAEISYAVF